MSKIVINENLDYISAKKIYNGDLEVKGDILSGINTIIKGKLYVHGIVENVKIKTLGDVHINGGFLGQEEGLISCNGNFYAGYVLNSNIKAQEIIIGESITNSNVVSIKGLTVKGKGLIIGGNYYIKDYLIAKEIGSEQLVETNIKLGYDFLKKRRFDILKKRLIEIKMKLNDNLKAFKNIYKNIDYPYFEIDTIMKNLSKLNEEKGKLLKLLEQIELKEEFEKLKISVKNFKSENIANLNAYLKTEVIYPGVEISILDKYLSVNRKIEQKNLILKREDIDKWQQY